MRHFASLIILLASISGSALDSWAGGSDVAFGGRPVPAARVHSACSEVAEVIGSSETTHESHASVEEAPTPGGDHHCHIGHCSFVLAKADIANTILPANVPFTNRPDILPDDLISYIPRPPSAPALA